MENSQYTPPWLANEGSVYVVYCASSKFALCFALIIGVLLDYWAALFQGPPVGKTQPKRCP